MVAFKYKSFNRDIKNRICSVWMFFWLVFIILLPVLLATGLYLKSSLLLENNSIIDLIVSRDWKPLSGEFGFYPFIISSLWVTILSLIIAGPICILSAIHLTQYASIHFLKVVRPVVDILAGIPSVIYGVWGVLIIVPFISSKIAPLFGKQISGYCILSGAIVLSVMIIPFMLNIIIEVLKSIPIELQEASLSLGASKWETVKHVLLKKAFPGIISAMGLGLSRAFGETIAVLMVVGNVTRIPKGALQPGYPLPALIANNYGEMLSIPMYDSALMLAALVLFVIVLVFNLLSRLLIIRFENLV